MKKGVRCTPPHDAKYHVYAPYTLEQKIETAFREAYIYTIIHPFWNSSNALGAQHSHRYIQIGVYIAAADIQRCTFFALSRALYSFFFVCTMQPVPLYIYLPRPRARTIDKLRRIPFPIHPATHTRHNMSRSRRNFSCLEWGSTAQVPLCGRFLRWRICIRSFSLRRSKRVAPTARSSSLCYDRELVILTYLNFWASSLYDYIRLENEATLWFIAWNSDLWEEWTKASWAKLFLLTLHSFLDAAESLYVIYTVVHHFLYEKKRMRIFRE